MGIDAFIDFVKVTYHLYLTEVLEEAEMVEYLWDAESDVIFYDKNEVVVIYQPDDVISTKITVFANLDVEVETHFDDFE